MKRLKYKCGSQVYGSHTVVKLHTTGYGMTPILITSMVYQLTHEQWITITMGSD